MPEIKISLFIYYQYNGFEGKIQDKQI